MVGLSPEEKIFIVHGIEQDIRNDGRTRLQYRPIEIETGIIPHAMGSARVCTGNTDIIVCVKGSTCKPSDNKPEDSNLEFCIDFSAIASPNFEGRWGDQISEDYTAVLNKLYSSTKLESLCIKPGILCWKLSVDIEVLSFEGNIYDTISFGVKAALANTHLPKISTTDEDKGEEEFQVSDDPSDTWTPDASTVPCFVTLWKIGEHIVVDPTLNEEQCSSFACVIAFTEDGKIWSTVSVGPGSVQPSTFLNLTSEAKILAEEVNTNLNRIIQKEKAMVRREIIGFLS
uniref:Ribosomal RNA-processing protein 42 n=1 Tax=Triatoma infestans TaxID=30076 RepID=A0A023F8P6_TRIIF